MGRKAVWPPPIYHHQRDGVERVRLRVNGKPVDRVLGPIGSEQARQEYARICAELSAGRVPHSPKSQARLTVADVVALWLEHAERTYDPRGRELPNHRLSLAPLLRLYGHTPAAEFDAERLEVVQLAMATGSWQTEEERRADARRKRPVGWCRNVVNRRITRIRTAWRWLERKGHVPKGSFDHLRSLPCLPKNHRQARNTPKRRPTRDQDLAKVLPLCPPAVAAMLEVQHLAGMRSAEVRQMRAGEIDRSGDVWEYRPGRHKGDWREDDAGRRIHLGPRCQAVLLSWLEAAEPEGYLFPPSRRQKNGHPCYTSFSYAQAVRRACARAGVKVLPYGGRHAAKKRLKRLKGADAARAVLGHKSVDMTEKYGDDDADWAAEIMREVG